MIQDSNDTATSRLLRDSQGLLSPGAPWVVALTSRRSLIAHIEIMLGASATMSMLNLVLNPGSLWSRAIIVVWLVGLVAHAVGIVVVRLLNEDSEASGGIARRAQAEPHAGPPSSWALVTDETPSDLQPNPENTPEPEREDPWQHVQTPPEESETSWPQAATASPDSSEAHDEGEDREIREPAEETSERERVPWRAATEIAWLRGRGFQGSGSDAHGQDSAS